MKKQVLVTGGAGFIGTHFIDFLLANTDYDVTNLDSLTYAANLDALHNYHEHPRYRFIRGDIREREELSLAFDRVYDKVFHFAAETDVDRSIADAKPFYETNVAGTINLLEFMRKGLGKHFIYISTDEVYGSLEENEPPFQENALLAANNPYSASKASAELFVRAYANTYNLSVMITRCSNNYGPYQHREKLIPKVILRALSNQKIPLYGDGRQIRDWLYVTDHCRAIYLIAEKGSPGEIYNIASGVELTNFQLVRSILKVLKKDEQLISFVDDRLGHDRRYSLDTKKLRGLGFMPVINFSTGIKKTVQWYKRYKKENEGEA